MKRDSIIVCVVDLWTNVLMREMPFISMESLTRINVRLMKNIQEIRENNIRESSIKQFRGRNWYCTNPVDTMTSLRRRYSTSLRRWHIFAIEMSDDVGKTTSLQRHIKRRHNEMLQWRRFCNVVWRFHRN